MSRAYLLGALHDGTIRPRTIRISQREERYVLFLKRLVNRLGSRAWTYREGKGRNLFVVEFSRSVLEGSAILTWENKLDYARGYFDAEGSVPANSAAEPYLYFRKRAEEIWRSCDASSSSFVLAVARFTIRVIKWLRTTGAFMLVGNPSRGSPRLSVHGTLGNPRF